MATHMKRRVQKIQADKLTFFITRTDQTIAQ